MAEKPKAVYFSTAHISSLNASIEATETLLFEHQRYRTVDLQNNFPSTFFCTILRRSQSHESLRCRHRRLAAYRISPRSSSTCLLLWRHNHKKFPSFPFHRQFFFNYTNPYSPWNTLRITDVISHRRFYSINNFLLYYK